MMREGTIVDATLFAAPPSTKNQDKQRDLEMHQFNGNDWHFGMKAHIGVDAMSGLVHTFIGTAGNVADLTQGTRCCTTTRLPRWATPATKVLKNARRIRVNR